MKKITTLLLLLIVIDFYAQCDIKTTIRPEGDTIKYFNPTPVYRSSDYELGISLYKNITTDKFFVSLTVLFKKIAPSNVYGELLIQTSDERGIRLPLSVSEQVVMKGREVSIALYEVDNKSLNSISQQAIQKVNFYLNGKLYGANLTENKRLFFKQFNCLKANTRFSTPEKSSLNDILNNKTDSKNNGNKSKAQSLNDYLNSDTAVEEPFKLLGATDPIDYGKDVSSKKATKDLPAGFSHFSPYNPKNIQAIKQKERRTYWTIALILVAILIVVFIFVYNLKKLNVIKPLNFDGFYLSKQDVDNTTIYLVLIFTKKGFVMLQEVEFEGDILMDKQFQKDINDLLIDSLFVDEIEVSPLASTYYFNKDKVSFKFYDPNDIGNKSIFDNEVREPSVYSEWSGKILENKLKLDYYESFYNSPLKQYIKKKRFENIVFNFYKIDQTEQEEHKETSKPTIPIPKTQNQEKKSKKNKPIKYVNYQTNFSSNQSNYPIIKIPAEGSIVRTHYYINNRLRGVSELGFEAILSFYFSNHFEVRGNVKLNTSAKTRPYQPDIALIDHSNRNIRIDIEIDEPYSGKSRIPTHCKGDDLFRDQYFVDRGWIVVRFTEHQVITQQENCLFLIASLLHSIDDIYEIPNQLLGFGFPEAEDFWDTLQAKKWMLNNYREDYLGITFEAEENPIDIEREFTEQDLQEEEQVSSTYFKTPEHQEIINNRDDNIQFFEDSHTYTVNGVSFQSVSTIISRFFREFDPDEAIDRMMNGPNWNPGNRYWGMSPDEIKELWRENGETQAKLGQDLHKQIEGFFNDEDYKQEDVFHYFLDFINDHPTISPFETEWRIYDEEYHIAGTVDLVSNDGNNFDIYDWKRSKNILDKYTLEPIDYSEWGNGFGVLNHIDDTGFNKYCLQLNMYRYILEKHYNIQIRNMYLVVLHPVYETYHKLPVNYFHDEVEQILKAI